MESTKFKNTLVERYNAILQILEHGKTSGDISKYLGMNSNMTTSMMYKLLKVGYVSKTLTKRHGVKTQFLYTANENEIKEEHIYHVYVSPIVEESKPYPSIRYIAERHPVRNPMDKKASTKVYIGCSFSII